MQKTPSNSVFFKLPFSNQIYTLNQKSDENPVSFFSFDQKQTADFYGEIQEISETDFLNLEFSDSSFPALPATKTETEAEYLQKLSDLIGFIKENKLPKLVLSRRKLLNFQTQFNCNQSFLNLCKSFPNAFVYVFVNDNSAWIGAFSELLGKYEKSTETFQTMSLAGTIPLNEEWTDKEINEQKPVTDYIKNILNQFSSTVFQSETHDHISGNIKHLRTDFQLNVEASKVESLITELHPTPAVCGIPKDFCMNAIADFEKNPRKFYAGYSRVETEDFLYYFVNLRCAELFKNAAVLYLGGGITSDSSPENEWKETELKSEALLKNLSFF